MLADAELLELSKELDGMDGTDFVYKSTNVIGFTVLCVRKECGGYPYSLKRFE